MVVTSLLEGEKKGIGRVYIFQYHGKSVKHMGESLVMNRSDALTPREQDIFQLLSEGLSDQEIAQELILALGTVKWYNKQIYDKLQVRNRVEAALLAQRASRE